MVEAEFLLELLMCLSADPSRLDGSGKLAQRRIGRQVGDIIFVLSARPTFADKPDLVTGHGLDAVVGHAMAVPLGDPDAPGSEQTGKPPLRATAPCDLSPRLVAKHVCDRYRRLVGNVVFAWPSAAGLWESQFHIGWVDGLARRQAHRLR